MKQRLFGLLLIAACVFPSFANGKLDSEAVYENLEEAKEGKKQKNPKYKLRKPEGEPVRFKESWGYVSQTRADEYNPEIPVTDVCLFAADFNCYGELIDAPVRSKISLPENVRCHFVVICDSKSLTHFVISPDYSVREQAINQIIDACADFDGLQLDFELVPVRDWQIYLEFMKLVRKALDEKYGEGSKIFSACVPGRFKQAKDDLYQYSQIANECDRVFVMAYDEHWSTSKPGAVASLEWCQKVVEYAQSTIPPEKLIMGVPFYGRTWADKSPAGAWYFSGANRVMTENDVTRVIYKDEIPTFEYTAIVHVTGYFNDAYSVLQLCRLYESATCQNIGFWRIGQEDPSFWDWLKVE